MEIKQTTVAVVTESDLANTLRWATPQEFAEFWLYFSKAIEKDEKRIDEFAKAMAPSFGGKRKEALNKIYDLMKYYEIQAQKKDG